jgi:hypothetical protein
MNQKYLGCLTGMLCLLWAETTTSGNERPLAAPRCKPERGEFGGDLHFLRRYYSPPRAEGESNHYFDLWNGTTLPVLAKTHGLTNNRTLFIDSHGCGDKVLSRNRYAYYPHRTLLAQNQTLPYYSARDLALVLGQSVSEIHNIFVGGCNTEGNFDPLELRKYFTNATNIVHAAEGQDSFRSMFFAAIVNPSSANRPLYAIPGKTRDGHPAFHLQEKWTATAIKADPYVACLFRQGEAQPFRIQVAGRELLEPLYSRPQSP